MASKEEKHIGVWRPTRQGRERIGAIFFHKKVEKLDIKSTATNVHLKIPATIELSLGQSTWPPVLTNLRAIISLRLSSGSMIEVGMARDENYYISETPEGNHKAKFIWRDAVAGLIYIEKNRGDAGPVFQIELQGELCYIVNCKQWFPDEPGKFRTGESPADVRTRSKEVLTGLIEISYLGEVWARMIRKAFEASQEVTLQRLF
jgi:predicted RNase H-like HicB family nuclease